MRQVGVITFARSEYGCCLPVLQAIAADPGLSLHLVVSGAHLAPEFGWTVKDIEADGLPIAETIEMLVSSDRPEGIAKSVGLGVIGLAQSFARRRPDILLLVGDRLELLAAAAAALPFRIPVAHVSGGDQTEGAIDNQVRHAVSKMSHVHFVAMEAHARCLMQMGEEPWRVFVTGEPALDLIPQLEFLNRGELGARLGLELKPPVLVVTHHPTTLGPDAAEEIEALLAALERVPGTLVFTYPNADTQSRAIVRRVREFVTGRPESALFENLGQLRYYSLLAQADLMVGNSSSGIWEAPSFGLPAVNIGDRQRGRRRARNVLDVPAEAGPIEGAIRRGLEPSFRASLRGLPNPYGDGRAAGRIVSVLKQIDLGPRLLQKKFCEPPGRAGDAGKLLA